AISLPSTLESAGGRPTYGRLPRILGIFDAAASRSTRRRLRRPARADAALCACWRRSRRLLHVNIERIGFDSTLSRFAEEAKRFPMLTAEEERRLALAWRDRRDPRALDRLVGSHLRFVLKIARGYRGY